MNLPYEVTRTIVIEATRETVFRYFTDSERWAQWWGAGSTVDARVGGAIKVRHSNGFESVGEVLEIVPLEKFVFTFSMQAAQIIPPEESRVEMTLQAQGASTAVTVRHQLADENVAKLMPQGWRFHFSRFANAVADFLYADAASVVDHWYALWTEPDTAARTMGLRAIAADRVRFHDQYSALEGIEDIVEQLGAVQRFMPGLKFGRNGEVRQCQGMALTEWAAVKADGAEAMAGSAVFAFSGNLLVAVTAFSK